MSMFNNNQPYMPGFGFRPQIFQQAGMPQQTPQQSTVTYVTSRAQAEVAQIPFDGMMYFFLNTSTRELYGKAFDPNTGSCPLIDYAPVAPAAPVQQPQWATVEMVNELAQRLDALTAPRSTRKKEADAE
jgi:hypothetical protein